MKANRTGLFWVTGLCVAVAVHAIGVVVFRVEEGTEPAGEADYSFASLPPWRTAAEGTLLHEQAFLFDSAPLFLPTRWNAATMPPIRSLEQRPPELFDTFPGRFSYSEADFGQQAIEASEPELNVATLNALAGGMRMPWGREPLEVPKLTPRFAVIEVLDIGRGEVVASKRLSLEEKPAAATRQLWAPAEFSIHLESIGAVGDPVLLRSSGIEEIDVLLRDQVAQFLRETSLETGYFRVIVGP